MPGLKLITGPAVEPLDIDELKEHLRIGAESTPEQDRDLERKLAAARRWVESRTCRALISQTFEYWFDSWPGYYGVPYAAYLEIPKAPLLSVESVSSYGEDNVAVALDADVYAVDLALGRILLNAEESWPSDFRRYGAGVVAFTAGYGESAEDVPQDLIQAVAEYVDYLWSADPESLVRAEGLVARYEVVTV